MPPPLTRIISDLHYRDADCRCEDLRELDPLLEGVDHLILNGDSIDTQRTPEPEVHTSDLKRYLASRCSQVTFITGNHDPRISPLTHLSEAAGAVWLFHGDILYEGIAPWSCLGPTFAAEVRRRRARLTAPELDQLEVLFQIHRQVCEEIHVEFEVARRDWGYRLFRLARSLLPPRQLWSMLEVWRHMPRDAAAFAEQHAPQAKFVVVGHSHAPTVARIGERIVINTGSFCRPRGQCCVDLQADLLRIRPVKRTASGFAPQAPTHEFPLAKSVT